MFALITDPNPVVRALLRHLIEGDGVEVEEHTNTLGDGQLQELFDKRGNMPIDCIVTAGPLPAPQIVRRGLAECNGKRSPIVQVDLVQLIASSPKGQLRSEPLVN